MLEYLVDALQYLEQCYMLCLQNDILILPYIDGTVNIVC